MSLLKINALKAENSFERSQYAEMQGRVMTMALIHEKLYLSPVSGFIEGQAYFSELLKNVVSASATPSVNCFMAPGIFFDIDKAIPCGLIINQLATNSLKYAFHHQAERYYLPGMDNESTCILDYSDNGDGFPDSYDFSVSETLGIRLIHMLVRQLKGVISITNNKGVHFCIRFPLNIHEQELRTSAAQVAEQTTHTRWA